MISINTESQTCYWERKKAEASNLQSKFKYEKSNIKEGNKTRTNASITDNIKSFF